MVKHIDEKIVNNLIPSTLLLLILTIADTQFNFTVNYRIEMERNRTMPIPSNKNCLEFHN